MWGVIYGVLLSVLIIAGSYLYQHRVFIRDKVQLLKVLYAMATGIAMPTAPAPAAGMHVHASQRYAVFDYDRMGMPYTLRVPYDAGKMLAMRPLTVTLIAKDNTPHDITQQPGFPYLLSAGQMEGQQIMVVNKFTGARTVFEVDVIPMYIL